MSLVDLRSTPITRVVPAGIEFGDGTLLELDAIVYATGFDAMTGALSRIDVRGRDGRRLGDEWAAAPTAYLGVAVAGFPNLFTVTGPGSPSVLTNMVTSIEHHVEWITTLLDEMHASGQRVVEASADAQDEWADHVTSQAGPIQVHESCTSWYLGANVPGKTRAYMPYSAGLDVYMAHCAPWPRTAIPGSTAPDPRQVTGRRRGVDDSSAQPPSVRWARVRCGRGIGPWARRFTTAKIFSEG